MTRLCVPDSIIIVQMSRGVAGFDDRLNQVLEQQAGKAGETVDAYIRRSVVARLVKELRGEENSALGQLLLQLEKIDVKSIEADEKSDTDKATLADPGRLLAVENTGLMDSPPDGNYDRLMSMASDALTVPGAAISLLDRDRQFFKSSKGLPSALAEARQSSLDLSICKYTVSSGEPLIVEDARLDEVLKDHPAVLSHIIVSYLGIPLKDDEGHAVGTLCVWDEQPRQWTIGHVQILEDLAWIVRERIFG